MRVTLLYNADSGPADAPSHASRADVSNVASEVRAALRAAQHTVSVVAIRRQLDAVSAAVRRTQPDVVFNLCESWLADARGEGLVPTILDALGSPYTGNTGMALALCLHKVHAKEVLLANDIPTPRSAVAFAPGEVARLRVPLPVIVKPSREDASEGITAASVVTEARELRRGVARVLRDFAQPALIERYVEGREISVAMLGERVLGATEIHFAPGAPRVVSYAAKWQPDSRAYRATPSFAVKLPLRLERSCFRVASAAFLALGCRDYGRVDLRVDERGKPFVIDVNPNCDLHPEAGYAKAARAAGLSYQALVARLVEMAYERDHGNSPLGRTRPRPVGRALATNQKLQLRRSVGRPRPAR